MVYYMFTVKDIVAGTFSDIKLFANEQLAKRWYNQLLAESKIAKDLQLYCIGTFNIETGLLLTTEPNFIQGGLINE